MIDVTNTTIPVKEAQEWVNAWRAKFATCKGFLIPAEDLVAVLKEMNILKEDNGQFVLNEDNVSDNGARAYLAIDDKEPEGNGEKLLIVGTTKEPDGTHKDIIYENSKDGNSGIYDFTKPCPSTCDVTSPLFR